MPFEGPGSPDDWYRNEQWGGAYPELDGGLTLAPVSKIPDCGYLALTPDGGTAVLRLGASKPYDGYHSYAPPEPGLGADALGRQTGEPKPPHETWVGSQRFLPGTRPNLSSGTIPPPPVITKIRLAADKQGYAAGPILICWVAVTPGGAYTTPTDPVGATLQTGQGYRAAPPPDMPEGCDRWALFQAEPVGAGGTPNPATMREQRMISRGQPFAEMSGPYRTTGRRLPLYNETFVGRPPQPRWGHEIRIGKAPRDLQMMTLNVIIVETNARGESLASIRSEERATPRKRTRKETPVRATVRLRQRALAGDNVLRVETTAARIPAGTTIVFGLDGGARASCRVRGGGVVQGSREVPVEVISTPIPDGRASDPFPAVFVEVVEEALPDHAIWARCPRHHPDTTGFLVFVQVGREPFSRIYRLVDTELIYRDAPFTLDREVPIYGYVLTDSAEGLAEGLVPAPAVGPGGVGVKHVLVEADLPESDTTGVEGPTGETEPPAATGQARPAPGRYPMTYAPVIGGVEQRAAVPQHVVLGDNEIPVMWVPHPSNRLVDPGGIERGQDGQPLHWTNALALPGAPGTAVGRDYGLPGRPGVRTLGSLVGNPGYPFRETRRVRVDRSRVETLRGDIEVGDFVGSAAGRGRAVAVFYGPAVPLQVVLAERGTNGRQAFRKSIGPSGSGADVEYPDDATEYAVRVDTGVADGRDLGVRVSNLAAHPYDGAPPRVLLPPPGAARIADPNPPPEVPYPTGPVACITVPPTASPVTGSAPLAVLDAEDGADPATKGWVSIRSGPARQEINEGARLEGTKGYRFWKPTSGQLGSAGWLFDVPLASNDGGALAIRGSFAAGLLPTAPYKAVTVLYVGNGSGSPMGFVRVHQNGAVYLVSLNSSFVFAERGIINNFVAGEVLAAEIRVSGAGTANGRVALLMGRQGAALSEVASIERVDWRGWLARRVIFGAFDETDPSSFWEFYHDRLVVTVAGDVLDAGGTSVEPPNRPLDASGTPLELDASGNRIHQLVVSVPKLDATAGGIDAAAAAGVEIEHEDVAVVPGVEQTIAVWARIEDVPLDPATRPYLVTLADGKGGVVEVGSPLDGASGTLGWRDYWLPFTPPPGFYRARISFPGRMDGNRRFQQPILADGRLDTQEARDDARRRAEERAEEGGVRVLIEPKIRDKTAIYTDYNEEWVGLGVTAEVPPGAEEPSVLYRSTDDPDGVLWESGPAAMPQDVEWHKRWADLDVTLRRSPADPTSAPTIPPKGAGVTFATFPPTLLLPDRSALPGGSVVVGLDRPYDRSNYRTDEVAGHAAPVPITERIRRLDAIWVAFYHPGAVQRFKTEMLDHPWVIESRLFNAIMEVNLYEIAEADPYQKEELEERIGYIWTGFSIGRLEVLEVGRLDPNGPEPE